MHFSKAFAPLAALALLVSSAPASARRFEISYREHAPAHRHHHHEAPLLYHHGHVRSSYRRALGGGPSDRGVYPHGYDSLRGYYGGRGDDRWRWYDQPDPGFIGAPLPWYGGPFGLDPRGR